MKLSRPARYGRKFYRSPRNNLGFGLAIAASMLTYIFLTWPIAVPQGRGNFGVLWGLVSFAAAAAYLFSAWRADTNWRLSRTILMAAGAIQVGFGIIISFLIGPIGNDLWFWLAGLYDVTPGLLAIIAGLLIHAPSGERPTPEHVWQQLRREQKEAEHDQATAEPRRQ